MGKLMKKARDIRLIAIGLMAGMVLGYFIAVEPSPPQMPGGVTMTLAQLAPQPTNVPTSTEIPVDWFESPLGVRRVRLPEPLVMPEAPTMEKWRQPLIDRTEAPGFPQRRPAVQMVPARLWNNRPRGEWQSLPPGAPPTQYDLIDLDYVPDFKLPPN